MPVVLLHALGSTAGTWDDFAARLAAHGRHVLAVDLRGHGQSSWAEKYSLELMCDDVLGFLDDHGVEQADVVGHSMGGRVAVLLAQREPGRVRRLVVEDTPPPPERPPQEPLAPVAEPSEPLPFDWRLIEPIMTELRSPDAGWWERLNAITTPTLLVSGGPSSHVSVDALARMSEAIADCLLVTVQDAGHRVHSAKPDEFWSAVAPFLSRT
ncbi:alpha/beta hydrolase [Lentzea tibetensis]|uniref:Alpha/beta hydrolase n=1 Tax=Lentzea tibetensis TaxID=2591470 RepID=A0A563EVC7_9PSEU|nr:alpha/beta hydrolase [Lentzea tibetensis]